MTSFNPIGALQIVGMLSVGLVLWSGCAAEDSGMAAPTLGYMHQCDGDSDCGSGMLCHDTWPICISSQSTESTVSVALAPPAEEGMVPSHLDNVSVDGMSPHDLVLPKTVHIQGRIRVQNNPIQPSIPATIVAVANNTIIPGLHLRTQTTAGDTGYDLALVAGVAYTLSITVHDTVRPVHRLSMQHSQSLANVDIELPDMSAYPQVTGRVFRVTAMGNQPVKGVQVSAKLTNDYQQCTTAVTDKLGAYAMYCPIKMGSYTIHVGPQESGPVIPSFQARWPDKEQLVISEDRELPDIVIPGDDDAKKVTIRVVNPQGDPVTGVPLTVTRAFDDTENWQNAVFYGSGVSDLEGFSSIDVPSGAHRITAMPHTTSPWAISSLPAVMFDENEATTLTLAPKVHLTGTVVSHTNASQADTRVATRYTWVHPDTGLATQREYATQTAQDGHFSLPVDIGDHRISVTPSTHSALPRWTSTDALTIEANGASLTLELPPPALMEGTVRTPQGQGASHVAVTIYQTHGDWANVLATTLSDSNGRYHVILPSTEPTGL